MHCDSCNLCRVNGALVHESGCWHQYSQWNAEQGMWVRLVRCRTCGYDVPAGEQCCTEEEL